MLRPFAIALLLVSTATSAISAPTRLEQAAAIRDAALAKSEAYPLLEDRLRISPAPHRG